MRMEKEKIHVCPVERANSLDNRIRKWYQNPRKILSPYIREGMRVLDIGCGPGFFTVEIAKMVGTEGKVFAADLQDGMLKIVSDKIKGTEIENRIITVKCDTDKSNVTEKVDFILAFYMVHEVPDKMLFFYDMKNILKEKGEFLIVEPKYFHVSKDDFNFTISQAEKSGLKAYAGPKLLLSQTVILRNN